MSAPSGSTRRQRVDGGVVVTHHGRAAATTAG